MSEDVIRYEPFEYIKENGAKMDEKELKSHFPLFQPGAGPAMSKKFGKNNDLTKNAAAEGEEAIGQRIMVKGTVYDENHNRVPNAFIEIWQANAAGRYVHKLDSWDAPLDPNFVGSGWTHTDENGNYEFITIMPGNYCWKPEENYWRPAHIHFSVMGPSVNDRLVTQLYFQGDPLLEYDDEIFLQLEEHEKKKLIATFNHELTEPDWALAYQFDMVLSGPDSQPSMPNRHQLTDHDIAYIKKAKTRKQGGEA